MPSAAEACSRVPGMARCARTSGLRSPMSAMRGGEDIFWRLPLLQLERELVDLALAVALGERLGDLLGPPAAREAASPPPPQIARVPHGPPFGGAGHHHPPPAAP